MSIPWESYGFVFFVKETANILQLIIQESTNRTLTLTTSAEWWKGRESLPKWPKHAG